jgi:curved DNA-binding protein CbpA
MPPNIRLHLLTTTSIKQQIMGKAKDLYAVLQLGRNSSKSQIKSSFHRLSLKYHPDKTQSSDITARNYYRDILEAYQTLKDPKRRRLYDMSLKTRSLPTPRVSELKPIYKATRYRERDQITGESPKAVAAGLTKEETIINAVVLITGIVIFIFISFY